MLRVEVFKIIFLEVVWKLKVLGNVSFWKLLLFLDLVFNFIKHSFHKKLSLNLISIMLEASLKTFLTFSFVS